ncbi:nitrogen fixation protein NifZ [Rhodoplanes sp. SY1]|uniref:nitrogen fixation protein NifZ n=1 Tax=Rhodoplanes sp. SY1 TaxID=3166646 RepID=UPI0038B6A701
MGLGREEEVEIRAAPRFMPGEKVQSTKHIKNDGTYPRREIGDILVRKGDVGYVRDIGTFLQQFYVYAVEFVDRGVIVGMRGRELVSLDRPAVAADAADVITAATDTAATRTSETVAS